MSKKCVIEKYLYKSALSVNFVEVKKEDFLMIADLALKQLAISKTETTSEPCEWCKGDVSQYFDVNWYDFIDGERGNVNHCPNCGRKLKGDER